MYIYAPHVCRAFKGQWRVLVPLALELQTVTNHDVGAGNQTCIICKNNKYF